MQLQPAAEKDLSLIMDIINAAKRHLKAQNIGQWQNGYPDEACIQRDIAQRKGYLLADGASVLGYLCIDLDGEPAYEHLRGEWLSRGPYVVMHRLALSDQARGKGASGAVFQLVEQFALRRGVAAFRVDTDAGNQKMQHILRKNGFSHCGTIWFDNSEKIAFEKLLKA